MRLVLLSAVAISILAAQDQTGRIEGMVLDSATRQPVKKALVTLTFGGITGGADQNKGPQSASTDFSGAFAFSDVPPGDYRLTVTHANYPQDRGGGIRKSVRVSPGETAPRITVELTPGGSISGRILDEDGDPLNGCLVQPHPAKNFTQGIPMRRAPVTHEDGSYRLYDIPPGKYVMVAQCSVNVFQPRSLSSGPDPPPSSAYPVQYYPGATDLKSAQVIEIFPGTEKAGIDFDMRPVHVTRIRGKLTAGSADWHGRTDLQIQLAPLEAGPSGVPGFSVGGRVNPQDGSFELQRVFPGSYNLTAYSQGFARNGGPPDSSTRIGGTIRVDVGDKPLEISLPLQRAVDLTGTIEIERGNNNNNTTNQITPSQISIQLVGQNPIGGPPPVVRGSDDGTFTIKSVPPGEWRIRLMLPTAFLKSAWSGSDDITDRVLDLTSGIAGPLRLLVSTNVGTLKGGAPAGQMVFAVRLEDASFNQISAAAQADPNGQFTMQNLAPGKYRIASVIPGGSMPDEGGQEVTIREGETATLEIRP